MTTEPSDTGENEGQAILVTLGEPFRLAVGESAAIGELAIMFIEVSEDSRCPQGARCVWAGQAKARVRVEKGGALLGEYELTIGVMREGDVGEVEIDGLLLGLLGVEPYPKLDEQIEAGEYVVEMVVEPGG
ncbi:MAG: hypothetical protein OEV06_08400 [Anaerolineae bacterium]|nr:hypothetical protein [Anaerolineae bacterium]